jgi:hypothetical protein
MAQIIYASERHLAVSKWLRDNSTRAVVLRNYYALVHAYMDGHDIQLSDIESAGRALDRDGCRIRLLVGAPICLYKTAAQWADIFVAEQAETAQRQIS